MTKINMKTLKSLLYDVYMVSILMQYGHTEEEAKWIVANPIQGPPIPKSLELLRRLGGKPYGKYTRSSS